MEAPTESGAVQACAAVEPTPGISLSTWTALMNLPPLPEIPEPLRGGAFTVVMGAFLGEAADGRDLLRDLIRLGPQIDTFATVAPVGLSELAMDPPFPLPYGLRTSSSERSRRRRSTTSSRPSTRGREHHWPPSSSGT
jgi:hypothetical protein